MPANSKKVHFHKDIKRRRIRKCLSERIKRLNKKQSHYRTCEQQELEMQGAKGTMVKVEARTKVLMKKPVFNFVQSINQRVSNKIAFLFFGMMYIDEEALRSQGRDRSLIKSLFNFYSINSVRVNSDYLVVKIQLNYQNTYPIGYIIDRFKSQGDREYYEMAEMVERINGRMGAYRGFKAPSLYDHQIEKCLQKMKGRRCIILISPNVIAYSRELLEMTGYSIEAITSSCLANRSFLFDVFLSDNYMDEFKKHLSKFELARKLRSGQLSPEEYTRQSCIFSFSSIIDKHHNRIQFRSKRYNLEPGTMCWEIDEIIGLERLLEYQKVGEERLMEDYKARRAQKELREWQGLTNSSVDAPKEKPRITCGYICSGVKEE